METEMLKRDFFAGIDLLMISMYKMYKFCIICWPNFQIPFLKNLVIWYMKNIKC